MKQIGVDTFAIVSLPANAGLWPNRIVRDSFQSTNERQTIREDRTADAPATVTIGIAEASFYSAAGGLDNLTDADFNRLLAEIEVLQPNSFPKEPDSSSRSKVGKAADRGRHWRPLRSKELAKRPNRRR
jgi:hypothetical protein